jgi:hypothetical protein
MSKSTPQSHEAFRELLDTLWKGVELTGATAAGERDAAEGYRFFLHMLRTALQQFLDNDPLRPCFVPLIMPRLAQPWAAWSAPLDIWGANPYTLYDWAPLRGDGAYRIVGHRGTSVYLGVCLYSGGGWSGKMPERIGDSLNHNTLVCNADGTFEITIAADRPAEAQNFLELERDAHSVLIRQFFADPRQEQLARYDIERIPSAGPLPPLTDEELAHRLRSVTAFLSETGVNFLEAFGRPLPVVQDNVPSNVFDLASLDDRMSATGRALRGGTGFMYINPDHWYLFCRYELGADEALVIRLEPPRCEWWGLYAFNRYMQPHEYHFGGHNLVSIGSVVTDDDGIATIIVAHRDPGLPNWIGTEGRPSGILQLRWTNTGIQLDQKPDVPRPKTEVVKVGALRSQASATGVR